MDVHKVNGESFFYLYANSFLFSILEGKFNILVVLLLWVLSNKERPFSIIKVRTSCNFVSTKSKNGFFFFFYKTCHHSILFSEPEALKRVSIFERFNNRHLPVINRNKLFQHALILHLLDLSTNI